MINGLLIFVLIVFIIMFWRWPDIQNAVWHRKYSGLLLSEQQHTLLLRAMPIYNKMTDAERAKLASLSLIHI